MIRVDTFRSMSDVASSVIGVKEAMDARVLGDYLAEPLASPYVGWDAEVLTKGNAIKK